MAFKYLEKYEDAKLNLRKAGELDAELPANKMIEQIDVFTENMYSSIEQKARIKRKKL